MLAPVTQFDWIALYFCLINPGFLANRLQHALLHDMVAQGQFGVKSGRGFYNWRDRDVETYKKVSMDKLSRILSILAEN